MRILGIIPARGGSKGVPGKNIKLLNGKPLMAYTFEVAKESKLLTDIVLSSDDKDIIEAAKSMGISVPFVRPEILAQDQSATIDVIIHVLEFFSTQDIFYDAVCLLQVTSPFRSADFLDAAILKFTDSNCDSLVSVRKVPHEFNPHWTFFPNVDGHLKIATGDSEIIKRRQDLPDAFHRDGSIYLTKTDVILKQHSLYGARTAYIESPPEFYVNIDTLADWELAEVMAKKLL